MCKRQPLTRPSPKQAFIQREDAAANERIGTCRRDRHCPEVTNNRAMELSFRSGVTSNLMGQFLQTQIDSKVGW